MIAPTGPVRVAGFPIPAGPWLVCLGVAVVASLVVGCGTPQHRATPVAPVLPRPVEPPQLLLVEPPEPCATPLIEPPPPKPAEPKPVQPKPSPALLPPSKPRATILLDPGHGGKDPGAPSTSLSALHEKAVVLMIATDVGERLKARHIAVVPTRTTDRFVELDARAAMADRHKVDLFVSIHADAAPNHNARGATLYISRHASLRSQQAAKAIEAALSAAGIRTRGVRRSDFRVLVKHSRPAVLVECGYLTNVIDAKLLNSCSYRSIVAAAIADGIASHVAKTCRATLP